MHFYWTKIYDLYILKTLLFEGSYGQIDLFQDKKHFLSFLKFVLRVFQDLVGYCFRPGLQKGHTQKKNS